MISMIAILTMLFITSDYLFQSGVDKSSGNNPNNEIVGSSIHSDEEYEKIKELSTIWANALKTRDGKPRYEMMTEKAKEKFEQEQIIRSGQNWNYNIGESSPWVVDFEIEIDGMTANITYVTQTNEPTYYNTKESLSFVKQDGKLLVDDYQTIYENKLIRDEDLINQFFNEKHSTIEVNQENIRVSANRADIPLNQEWEIYYDKGLNQDLINENSIYVIDDNKNKVPVTVSVEDSNTLLIKPPSEGYLPGKSYDLYLDRDLDLEHNGNKELPNQYRIHFSTINNR